MMRVAGYIVGSILVLLIAAFVLWYNHSAVNNAEAKYTGKDTNAFLTKLESKGFQIATQKADGWFYIPSNQRHFLSPIIYRPHADALKAFCINKTCEIFSARKSTPYLGVAQKMERMIWASVNGTVGLVFSQHYPSMGNK
ncbi:hypothetical protein [uncultured Tateyamaria sp.]|uniref:hypothetical protein n=1 Tax=uncultured Tateyamaria sp. TaxID=455651 RepID=UPI00261627F9|nr:hypothetical protein [uncultured Tateyamaria sp.]